MFQLYGAFKEKTLTEIHIEDDPEAFRQFLNFLYYEKVSLSEENMFNIYAISHRYMSARLTQLASKFISDSANCSNIFHILTFNEIYNDPLIFAAAKRFFVNNTMACLKEKEAFCQLDLTIVKMLLSFDTLNIPEHILLESVLEWIKPHLDKESNSSVVGHNELQDLLHLIRLELSDDLKVVNKLPKNPRKTSFVKQDIRKFVSVNEKSFNGRLKFAKRKICFGFQFILSNINACEVTPEEFTITIRKDEEIVVELAFKLNNNGESLEIQEHLLDSPIIFDENTKYKYSFEFAESKLRIAGTTSAFKTSPLFLYFNTFDKELHSVFLNDTKKQ